LVEPGNTLFLEHRMKHSVAYSTLADGGSKVADAAAVGLMMPTDERVAKMQGDREKKLLSQKGKKK
jgi:hypothetical protein